MKTDAYSHKKSAPQPSAHPAILIPVLLACALLFLWTARSAQAPQPEPQPEPETGTAENQSPDNPNSDRFSARNAQETLAYLLGDQRPHPIGSEANQLVRDRIVKSLRDIGVSVDEQRTLACVPNAAHCGFVENVIGTIPGELRDSIVLMAHYDSTTNSPGAGDDGGGVATILEVLKVLASEASARDSQNRNTIRAVFTDGEEEGLFGAEAFFRDHPAAPRSKVLINVEGSGTAGPSNLLRTSPGSGDLVRMYRATAPHPMASSIATEIFKRMPNDTDFSVGMRAGIKGLDFAFAGERTHYHSPLDTVENLDLETLQHHGDNVLPLLRKLKGEDLEAIDGEVAYTTMLGIWTMWPESASRPLALLAAVVFLVCCWLRRNQASTKHSGLAVLVSLTALIIMMGLCATGLRFADRFVGVVPDWPGTKWPWRLLLLSAATLGWSVVGGPLAPRLRFHAMLNGVWFWMTVMALLLAFVAPLAASPFLAPLLLFSVLLALATALVRDATSPWWIVVGLSGAFAGVIYLGGLIPLLEETQGYGLAPAFYMPLAFTFLLLMPFWSLVTEIDPREPGPLLRSQAVHVSILALAGIAVAAVGLKATPHFTEFRPQPISLRHVQDLDREESIWWAAVRGPMPGALQEAVGFADRQLALPGLPSSAWTAAAPSFHWPPSLKPWPDQGQSLGPAEVSIEADRDLEPIASIEPLEVLEVTNSDDGATATLRLRSPRKAGLLRLLVPAEAGLQGVHINDRDTQVELAGSEREWETISIYAAPPEGVLVRLSLRSSDVHEYVLLDVAFELPDFAVPLLEARSPLAAPVHQGDRSMVLSRRSF